MQEGCVLCPRKCGVDRNIQRGACNAPCFPYVAKAALHMWEEPCISGKRGSGAIFFCGCNLKCVFCQNYDSPYLFYPLDQPHGKSVSGLLTLSSFGITEARRVELPIEAGVMKLVDLDRCYSVHRIPAADGRELVLYNVHLSAYTSDGTIAVEQLELLRADMQAEYEKGNWCIAGGDFNKDLLGQSEEIFGGSAEGYTWAQPLPEGIWDGTNLSLVAPLDETNPVPSCRNADAPYHEGQYVLTVDGFVVSDNVTVEQAVVEDTGFAWSDHNPVSMRFVLN